MSSTPSKYVGLKVGRWAGYTLCVGVFAVGAWATPVTPQGKTAQGKAGQGKPGKPKVKKAIDFNRDVRPILAKCLNCHGHDPKTVAAGLRLDDGPAAKKKLPSGQFAIVPGHPEKSELITRIYDKDGFILMPPKSSNKTLSAEEKATLKQWIAEGAEFKEHWAFVAPKRPPLPTVKNKTWAKNSIDSFILAQIEEKGLKPSPEADRRTLIRRVTLDITGLPPSPQETQAFVDDKSPNAYEKVVDRLLASPRYGERMAMDWMDYARYADSNGYQADFERFQWRWRDWVIDAFNQNMPYDRFTVEQIAGDMLPNATLEQKIATGFNRNHRINTEGGVVAEEWRVETVIDRVETTSAVWLGLTSGCARCHDHKYDPITQKDFYRMFAFFNNVPESGTGEERPVNHPPYIKAPTNEQALRMKVLEGELTKKGTEEDALIAPNEAKAADWKVPNPADTPELAKGRVARYHLVNPPTVEGSVPTPAVKGTLKYGIGRSSGAAATSVNGSVDLGSAGDFERDQPFSYGLWINPAMPGGSPMSRMDSYSDYQGWDLFLNGYRPAAHFISKWPENAMKLISKASLPQNQWSHVLVTYDGSAKPSGVRIYVNGVATETELEGMANLTRTMRTKVNARLGARGMSDAFTGQLDDAVIYSRVLQPDEVKALASVSPAAPIAAVPAGQRSAEQRRELTRLWLLDHDPAFKSLDDSLVRDKREREKLDNDIVTVMVMEEMAKPRDAFILERGQYDHRGAKVSAGLPSFLQIKGKSFPQNRLGLARWIVDPQNPLTARVTVNRLWERLFGTGIVPTIEDFGTRADFPTHPELLDWLAVDFVAQGWNLKSTLKKMVMSATYRQSSNVSPALLKADPTNRYYARGPRFRLPGEVIRDQAMFAGGLLKEKIGGPSVRPYQPDGVWDEVNVYGNLRNYKHDPDPSLHRRSLYTIWKRTAAPPTMTLFDVPSRETCRVSRARTDTPLQALTLMNDVTYVEASRALAQRMLTEGGDTPEARVKFAFRIVLARDANAKETQILVSGLQRHVTSYRANPTAAKKLISEGVLPNDSKLDVAELAAYTLAASTILNLDETVTKE